MTLLVPGGLAGISAQCVCKCSLHLGTPKHRAGTQIRVIPSPQNPSKPQLPIASTMGQHCPLPTEARVLQPAAPAFPCGS